MRRAVCLLLGALILPTGALSGQETPPQAAPDTTHEAEPEAVRAAERLRPSAGSMLRIRRPTGEVVVGELTSATSDSMVVRQADSTSVCVLMTEAAEVEMRESISRMEAATDWGFKGFVIGGTIGAMLPLTNCGVCGGEDPKLQDLATSGLAVAGVTGLVGAIAGALDPGERWTKIDKPKKR